MIRVGDLSEGPGLLSAALLINCSLFIQCSVIGKVSLLPSKKLFNRL